MSRDCTGKTQRDGRGRPRFPPARRDIEALAAACRTRHPPRGLAIGQRAHDRAPRGRDERSASAGARAPRHGSRRGHRQPARRQRARRPPAELGEPAARRPRSAAVNSVARAQAHPVGHHAMPGPRESFDSHEIVHGLADVVPGVECRRLIRCKELRRAENSATRGGPRGPVRRRRAPGSPRPPNAAAASASPASSRSGAGADGHATCAAAIRCSARSKSVAPAAPAACATPGRQASGRVGGGRARGTVSARGSGLAGSTEQRPSRRRRPRARSNSAIAHRLKRPSRRVVIDDARSVTSTTTT